MDPLDLHAFLDLVDEGYNVVPLHVTLQLDRETPVSLYQRVGQRAIFLLESASLGEETGRYSFIGLDRRWRLSTRDEVTVLESDTYAETDLAPLDELRRLLEHLSHVRARADCPTSSAARWDLSPTTTYGASNDCRVERPHPVGPTSTSRSPTQC